MMPTGLPKQVLRMALSWACLQHAVLPGMLVAMAWVVFLCKQAWQSLSPLGGLCAHIDDLVSFSSCMLACMMTACKCGRSTKSC